MTTPDMEARIAELEADNARLRKIVQAADVLAQAAWSLDCSLLGAALPGGPDRLYALRKAEYEYAALTTYGKAKEVV